MADQNNKAIAAAARALADRSADACGVNRDDNWRLYIDDFTADATAALGAYLAATPAVPAPALTDDQIMDMAEPFHDVGDVKFDEVAFARHLLATRTPEATSEQMGGVQVAMPRVLGVSRDAESPSGKGLLVAFERALTDDELRHFHDSLTAPATESAAAPADLSKLIDALKEIKFCCAAPAGPTMRKIASDALANIATPRAAEGEATSERPVDCRDDGCQPLMEEEIWKLAGDVYADGNRDDVRFARTIEQHHGIGSGK
jgi:hypothetical protein